MKGHVFEAALFAAYTVASVAGLLLMKQWIPVATSTWEWRPTAPVILAAMGVLVYILSFLIWVVIITRLEISVAYPTAIGLTLLFSTLSGFIFFGEVASLQKVAGIGLIFCGILLVVRSTAQ